MVEYNNTNKVGLQGSKNSSQASSQVDGLLNGLKSDLKNAVAQGDVTNIELLESTISEIESQRETTPAPSSSVQQKSVTQQYYEDEFGEDDDENFSIVGPSLDDIEIVQLSGEFKTFEEATGFMVNSLNNLDKILASKGS